MRLEAADIVELAPVIHAVVREAMEQIQQSEATLGDRLAYSEPEAAALLGVRPHVLRDCRLRGQISASRIGKTVRYSRNDLLQFLNTQRATT